MMPLMNRHQSQIFRLTLRISMLFIMILQGRRGPKSAEQQRAKTQSETKYLALIKTDKTERVMCVEWHPNQLVRKYRWYTRRSVGIHRLHQRSPSLVRLARGNRGSHLRVRPRNSLHPCSVAYGCGDSGKQSMRMRCRDIHGTFC